MSRMSHRHRVNVLSRRPVMPSPVYHITDVQYRSVRVDVPITSHGHPFVRPVDICGCRHLYVERM